MFALVPKREAHVVPRFRLPSLESLECRRLLTAYWVDPGGNNSNPGSQSQPFSTITYAAALAEPGDTINVDGGTYRGEHIAFSHSGTSSARITLQATTNPTTGLPEAVYIKGSIIANSWSLVSGSIYEYTSWNDYFPVENAGAGDAQNQPGNQFFANGVYLQEKTSQSAMIAGSFYINHSAHTVYLWMPDSSNPSSATIEGTNQGNKDEYGSSGFNPLLNTNAQSYVTISNLNFSDFSGWYQDGMGMVVDGQPTSAAPTNNVFYNDSFDYSGSVGLWAYNATSNLFIGDTYTNDGDYGLAGTDLTNCTFKTQTLFDNANELDKQYDKGSSGAMKISDSTGTVFDSSVVDGNNGNGIWFDVDDTNSTIDGNTVYNNIDNGIQYEISFTATIENNESYDNGNSGSNAIGIFISSSSGCIVDYNTVYGNSAQGISIDSASRGDSGGSPVVSYWGYDDTVDYNIIGYNENSTNNTKSFALGWGDDLGNVDACTPQYPKSGIPVVPNSSDYNDFYIPTSKLFFIGSGSNRFNTLAQWQAASGQDEHSVFANPQFVHAPSDFHLAATSPALTLGSFSSSLSGDATDVPLTADLTDTGSAYGTYATNSGVLPSGWSDTNVNSSGGSGFQDSGSNTLRVGGSGVGVSGTSDALNFAAGTITGNGTIVTDLYQFAGAGSSASAGVMFRNSASNNAEFVSLMYSQAAGLGEVTFSARTSTGGTETSVASVNGITSGLPWLEVIRSGNSFTAFFSSNGVDWTQVGNADTVALSSSALAGLAVASGSSTVQSAIFLDTQSSASPSTGQRMNGLSNAGALQSAALPLPSGWSDADIAASPLTGYAYLGSGGSLYIAGGGPDIAGGGDHLNYASASLSGDASIITYVASQQNTNGSAKAGPMFRNSTASNDQFAGIFSTPNGVEFEWRTTAGATAGYTSPSGGPAPLWLKLTRSGNNFAAFDSTNGVTWTQVGTSESVMMAGNASGQILAGLAVTSHNTFNPSNDTGTTSHVVFSNTTIGSAGSIAAPAAPTNFVAVADVDTPGHANLAWVGNSTYASGYTIERSTTDTFGTAAVVATLAGNANSWTDPNATAGTTFYYWIFATDSAGDSADVNATLT